MDTILTLVCGGVVGMSLGLTGGGGAVFAVPLLVYVLEQSSRGAVGISLLTVGTTALVGFVLRWWSGEVEMRTGLLFAVAGMLGAPLGVQVAAWLPDRVLLMGFAGVMVLVAVRLWRQASRLASEVHAPRAEFVGAAPTCQRNEIGHLVWSSSCVWLLSMLGLATGVLSGLFGVGGGFVIVPSLVLYSGMPIKRAIGTSLLVISLVSLSGVTSYLISNPSIDAILTLLFIGGGISGLLLGQYLATRISGPRLEKFFAVAMVLIAAFVLIQNLIGMEIR